MTRLLILLYTYFSSFLFFQVQISFLKSFDAARLAPTKRVAIFGATGRVGQLVVNELLNGRRNTTFTVKAIVRDSKKANDILPITNSELEIVTCDYTNSNELSKTLTDCDAAIWVATGFSDGPTSPLNKFLGLFKLQFSPKTTIDIKALRDIGIVMNSKKDAKGIISGGPSIVACSSAGVTRPTWNEQKKMKFMGASDIPIVRLNPLNILGIKRESEDELRKVCQSYTIVRPCGLNDKWPTGRIVLSQGDIAVGRTNRLDIAKFLIDCLFEKNAVGKTVECFTLPGYPSPQDYSNQFSRIRDDNSNQFTDEELFPLYNLLQQIVPGETLQPNKLAMGQTYEQLDKGEIGRLGERGTEIAPLKKSS